MSFALVGTIGSATQGTSGGQITFGAGTGENADIGNLLVIWLTGTGAATLPATPTDWSIAAQVQGTSCSSSLFYKVATGTESSVTISGVTSVVWTGQWAEYSGGDPVVPLSESGTATGTTSTITATFGAPDDYGADLVVAAGADRRSAAVSTTDTWSGTNWPTSVIGGSNNATSSQDHFSFAYGLGTRDQTVANTTVMSLSSTTSLTGAAVASATFALAPATIRYVGNCGSSSAKSNVALTLTVTQPVPVGALVYVRGGMDTTQGSVLVTDSQGNAWNTFAGVVRCSGAWSVLTNALTTSDTITFTPGAGVAAVAAVADFFVGLVAKTDFSDSSAGGSSATPSVGPSTPTFPDDLILGTVGVNGPSGDGFTEDTDTNGGDGWHTLKRLGTTGGGATSNATTNAAYKITTSAAAQTYNPSLGTSRNWGEHMISLRPATAKPDILVIRQAVNRASTF